MGAVSNLLLPSDGTADCLLTVIPLLSGRCPDVLHCCPLSSEVFRSTCVRSDVPITRDIYDPAAPLSLQRHNLKAAMGTRNRVYRNRVVVPARQVTQAGRKDSLESISGLPKSLKIPSQLKSEPVPEKKTILKAGHHTGSQSPPPPLNKSRNQFPFLLDLLDRLDLFNSRIGLTYSQEQSISSEHFLLIPVLKKSSSISLVATQSTHTCNCTFYMHVLLAVNALDKEAVSGFGIPRGFIMY